MKLGRILLYGFLIWVILFFIGWFLLTVVPNSMHILMLIIGVLLIYTFSKVVIDEKQIFMVGIVWLIINFILDLIFMVFILKNESYYSEWSIWVFYFILVIEPAIVKQLSK